MNTRLLTMTVLLVLFSGLFMSLAKTPDTNRPQEGVSFFDRLVDREITRFTLTFDLQDLEAMKYQDEYFPATFSHAGENWDAKLRVRGRYRRRICDFPPLKLKLSKDMLAAAGLQKHNKFKLVTHCSDNFDNRDNILREQLSYELYNLITGQGFRTKLVSVTYRDAHTGTTFERYGILIEDTDEMASAHGGVDCDDCTYAPQNSFVPGNLESVALFNYMVGNSDWSGVMQRNVKVVQKNDGGQNLMVPYDFDFSGLVDTEYAKPNPNFDQATIKDRVWIWDYSTPQGMELAIDQFLAKKEVVLAYVNNFTDLENRSRRQIVKYLDTFYESIEDGTFQAQL